MPSLEIVEFSLQMPGNAALFTVLCAIAVRRASVKQRHVGFRPPVSGKTGLRRKSLRFVPDCPRNGMWVSFR